MKYVDEYRDGTAASRLLQQIAQNTSQKWVLMEVCGGQTHGLLRYGIPQALNSSVELIHGPGCPVCVTSERDIDLAGQLALRPQTVVATFGDMLRVPGTSESLLSIRGRGGQVQTVYSPVDAVRLAAGDPDRQVVFFAVGFETTAPATALAVRQACQLGLTNFSMLVSHVRVQPAMEAILSSPHNRVQGFLAAGHVCAITGYHLFQSLVDQYQVPMAVTGFEPLDLLAGIRECIQQLESGQARVVNCYRRTVTEFGNSAAQQLVNSVYEIADTRWRGLGVIARGGFRLRSDYAALDARQRFAADRPGSAGLFSPPETPCQQLCRAGEVLTGQLRPVDCPEFGRRCTPETPLGAPMVSSEGACAAYFRFSPRESLSCSTGLQETDC